MLHVTRTALEKLRSLITEHPEDPVVRVTLTDLNESKLSFGIILDHAPHPDDDVREVDGVTIAVEGKSVARMDGITLDYAEEDGFRFLHPENPDLIRITPPQLN